MDNPELSIIIQSLGVTLYGDKSHDHTRDAQQNLRGRTHYCDPDTLKGFKSRIVAGNAACSGLVYWLIESCAIDYANSKRGFRAVAFDVFGTVLYRVDLASSFKTSEKARQGFYSWLNGFDLLGHYRDSLAVRATRAKQKHDDYRAAFNATFGETK